jgi:hypothetical protein
MDQNIRISHSTQALNLLLISVPLHMIGDIKRALPAVYKMTIFFPVNG